MEQDILDDVDFSYMDYPEGSAERILGRRKQAVMLAQRYCKENGEDYKDYSFGGRNTAYERAYFIIALEESRRVCND